MNNEKEKAPINKVEGAKLKDSEEKEIEAKTTEEIYLNDKDLHDSFYKLISTGTDIRLDTDELITVYGYFSINDNIPQETLLKMFKLLFQIRKNAVLLEQALQETQNCLKENSEILSNLRNADKKEC